MQLCNMEALVFDHHVRSRRLLFRNTNAGPDTFKMPIALGLELTNRFINHLTSQLLCIFEWCKPFDRVAEYVAVVVENFIGENILKRKMIGNNFYAYLAI